jgi:cell division protein FtsI (penicillin-binding protein 3)
MSRSDYGDDRTRSGFRWPGERVWSVDESWRRAKAEVREGADARARIFAVLAAFAGVFAILGIGAVRAALFSGVSESAVESSTTVAARADLVDRNGELLATNLVHYGLYVDPDEVWDVDGTYRALLVAAPSLNPQRLRKALTADHQSYLLGGLTPQQRDRIHALGLPGLSFAEEDRRVYPLGVSAAHLVGFADSGGRGIAGVERALDLPIRDAGHTGAPVALSIDMRVQGALEDEVAKAAEALHAKGAVGLVTDVRTGEILGMSSWPSYDPAAPGRASDDAKLNRAATSVYEMGSTFKVFTLSAGLDTGTATLASHFDATQPLRIGDRVIHDDEAENRVMSLADVFIHSSNIGTSRLALTMGGDVMTRYFRALGLFHAAPVELRETARPILPRRWDANTIASTAFGQAISVTPLQEAAAMGAVLNGGVYLPLTIKKLPAGARPKGVRVLSPSTTESMLELMRLNVLRGTGRNADVEGLRVGGKTGSAQKAMNGHYEQTKLVSSFAGVFPADGPVGTPRYFVLILIDEPVGGPYSHGQRTAAWTVAPSIGRVINRIAPFVGVERGPDTLAPRLAKLSTNANDRGAER